MFSKKPDHGLTTQDFYKTIQSLSAQQELIVRQQQEGSISEQRAQAEMQRLTRLISSYRKNMESTLEEEQRSAYSHR